MSEQTCCLVKLDAARVQTWLFHVSELKSMVGGNTLLGEVWRGRLLDGGFAAHVAHEEVAKHRNGSSCQADNLPALAVECGARWPGDDASLEQLGLPEPQADDATLDDRPRESYRHGVLARDGGHLHALFASRDDAASFLREARRLISKRLPGIGFDAHLVTLARHDGRWNKSEEPAPPESPDESGVAMFDLPQFQVCDVVGQGPAEDRQRRAQGEELEHVSAMVKAKRKAADRFAKGESQDVLGRLRESIVTRLELPGAEFPTEFSKLATSGYLAVIVADGNEVGKRYESLSQQDRGGGASSTGDFFTQEAAGEKFFHDMRRACRAALLRAIENTFKEHGESPGDVLPFRPLMLGGDDLLFVCDAPYALPFVREYAQALRDDNALRPPLDIGAGVAIVKSKFPFHRAHALAEQLAASAKRLYRSLPKDQRGSTVDWLVISEAWHDDLEQVRRRDFVNEYSVSSDKRRLVLSRRPYTILGEGESLEALLKASSAFLDRQTASSAGGDDRPVARSQLMALADALHAGKRHADAALRDAPAAVRDILVDKQVANGDRKTPSVWLETDGFTHSTRVLDFLEVAELDRMRSARRSKTETLVTP